MQSLKQTFIWNLKSDAKFNVKDAKMAKDAKIVQQIW